MLATPEIIQEATTPGRLAEVLPRWRREVPLYQRAETHAPSFEPDDLRRWPLITKADIRRDFPLNFLRAGAEFGSLIEEGDIELEHTSGTSEERTALLLPRDWWSEQERRALALNPLVAGVLQEFPEARRVTISSPVCSGDICYAGVPSRADRIVGNALFINLSRFPFLWGEADLARMAAETVEWQPQFLDVDPVYGVVFALYCERRGIRLPSLRFNLCSYEFVSIAHRRILERVFGVPVFNLYGSTETGHLLMETEDGGMRASLETAFLEIVNPDARGIGELVVTTLTNDIMPLIRYRIGDLVEREEQPYQTRYVVRGRVADAIARADGGRVTTWHVDQCFADLAGIVHYQLREQSGDEWQLRFISEGAGSTNPLVERLRSRLESLLGNGTTLTVRPVDLLMPESSGKFRLVVPGPAQPEAD